MDSLPVYWVFVEFNAEGIEVFERKATGKMISGGERKFWKILDFLASYDACYKSKKKIVCRESFSFGN